RSVNQALYPVYDYALLCGLCATPWPAPSSAVRGAGGRSRGAGALRERVEDGRAAALELDASQARNSLASVKMTSGFPLFKSATWTPGAHAAPTDVAPASCAASMSTCASPT